MLRFCIELLPDDVLRLIFVNWSQLETCKLLSRLDQAFCSSSVCGWFLEFVRSRGISMSMNLRLSHPFGRIEKLDAFVRWLVIRRFPLDSLHIELKNFPHELLLQAVQDDFSLLGSVRKIFIPFCWETIDVNVAAEMLRTLLTRLTSMDSIHIEPCRLSPDCIPWSILLNHGELKRVTVGFREARSPLVILPRNIQQRPRIILLAFNHLKFNWVEFEALLSSCPNLISLSLDDVEIVSAPIRDELSTKQPSVLEFLKELKYRAPCSDAVAEYLLRRCPNAESVLLAGGSFEWLPSMLQSSAVPHLRSIQIGDLFVQVDSTDKASILAQSSGPFQFTELCGSGGPAIQLLRLLQSAQPEKFYLCAETYKVGRAEFFRCHLSSPEFAALPLTHLQMAFNDDLGDAVEWLYMLRLPRLQHLEITSELDYRFWDGDLTDVLADSVCCQRESGISPSPRLAELSLLNIRFLHSVASQLVLLMPFVSTLHLEECPFDTQSMTACIVGFPLLSMLEILSITRNAAGEFDFGDVDFAGRPQLTIITDADMLPTRAILKSLVLGLGSHLKRLGIEYAKVSGGEALTSQPDMEFLAQNRHVFVSGLED